MRRALLGLVLVLAACASASQVTVVPLGFTQCSTRPDGSAVAVSWLRLDVAMQDPQRFVVASHEAEHARQVETFKTCGEYTTWRAANAARAEAMAMCASVLAAVRFAGMDADSALALHARIMSESYPELKVDRETAHKMIGAHCGR